jgi:ribose transport system substrate-binding protein
MGSPGRNRRFLGLCGAIVVSAVLLTACGSSSKTSDTGAAATGSHTTGASKRIVYIQDVLPANDFADSIICGVNEAAARLGVDVDVQGPPKADAAAQTAVLNAAIATKPDAIVIFASDDTALNAPLREAAKDGIKIVAVNTKLSDTSFLSSLVTTNDVQGGRLAGEQMIDAVGGHGKVLTVSLLAGLEGLSEGPGRQSAFADVMSANPDVDYLGVQYTQNDPQKASQIVSAELARNPDLAGIYLPAPVDSAGVFNALKSNGKLGKVKVVAFDPRQDLVQEMDQGNIAALIAQQSNKMGQLGIENAVKAVDGEDVPKSTVLPDTAIPSSKKDDPAFEKYFYKGC